MKTNQTKNQSIFTNNQSASLSSTSLFFPPQQQQQQSTHHTKREQFANSIRQQQRDKYKKIKRRQLLRAMGIYQQQQYEQQQHQHYERQSSQLLYQKMQQQQNSVYAQFITNQYSIISHDNDDDNNDNQQQHQREFFNINNNTNINFYANNNNDLITNSYKQIQHYKEKQIDNDPTMLWKIIEKDIREYLQQQKHINYHKLSTQQFDQIEKYHFKTLQQINHIISLEIFYQDLLLWNQFKIVQQQHYQLLLQFLWKVYLVQTKSQRGISEQLKQQISTLVLLIICCQLKQQNINKTMMSVSITVRNNYRNITGNNYRNINGNNYRNINGNNRNNRSRRNNYRTMMDREMMNREIELNNIENNIIESDNKDILKKQQLWQNSILFNQILQIPWLWGHWALIKQSQILDLKIYSINRMTQIISTVSNELNNQSTPSTTTNQQQQQQQQLQKRQPTDLIQTINQRLLQMNTLIRTLKQNLTQLLFNLKVYILPHNINHKIKQSQQYTELINRLKQFVINLYQCVAIVNAMIEKVIVRQKYNYQNGQQQQRLSQLMIQITKLLCKVDKIYFIIIKQYNKQSQQQQLNNYNLQQQQQQQLKQFRNRINQRKLLSQQHFIYKDDIFCRASNQYDVKGKFLQQFVKEKFIIMCQFVMLGAKNVFIVSDNNSNRNNTNSNKLPQQQLKCLSLILNNILYIAQNQQFITKIFQQCTQLTSIKQCTQQLNQIKQSDKHNLTTVYMILLCRELFSIFGKMCHTLLIQGKQQQQQVLKLSNNSDNDSRYNYQSMIVNNMILAIKTLNSLAQHQQQQSLWKFSSLLYQSTELTTIKYQYKLQQNMTNISNLSHKNNNAFMSLIQLCNKFLQFLNNTFKKRNKNDMKIRLIQIKYQIGTFLHNLVYNYFPIQTMFQQFDVGNRNKDCDDVRDVVKLVECYKGIVNSNGDDNGQYNQEDISRLQQLISSTLLSQQSLDKQTQHLLNIVQTLLQQTSIQIKIRSIRIVLSLIIMCENRDSFQYFERYIKSSTQIYKKIYYLMEHAQHSKVSQIAEKFIQQIDNNSEFLDLSQQKQWRGNNNNNINSRDNINDNTQQQQQRSHYNHHKEERQLEI